MTVDDGARLFVNGHTLIDAWHEQGERDYSDDIYLPAGPITVIMEYFEQTGAATARLRWQLLQPDGGNNNSGAVLVDDSDPNFTRGGLQRGWVTEYEGFNNNLTWTQNNDWARPQYNWGRWYPKLQPGRYEIFVYIPDRFSTTVECHLLDFASGRLFETGCQPEQLQQSMGLTRRLHLPRQQQGLSLARRCHRRDLPLTARGVGCGEVGARDRGFEIGRL